MKYQILLRFDTQWDANAFVDALSDGGFGRRFTASPNDAEMPVNENTIFNVTCNALRVEPESIAWLQSHMPPIPMLDEDMHSGTF